MTDEAAGLPSPRSPTLRGRRFRPQVVDLADGGKLALRADGSIEHIDAQGAVTASWTPVDPGWADHAIRFGVHTQAQTVAPHGRVQGTRPPRR